MISAHYRWRPRMTCAKLCFANISCKNIFWTACKSKFFVRWYFQIRFTVGAFFHFRYAMRTNLPNTMKLTHQISPNSPSQHEMLWYLRYIAQEEVSIQYEDHLKCSVSEPDWPLGFFLSPFNLHTHRQPTGSQGCLRKRIFNYHTIVIRSVIRWRCLKNACTGGTVWSVIHRDIGHKANVVITFKRNV